MCDFVAQSQRKSTVRDYGGLFSYPFYGTDGDAFHKILLHEGIEQDDRAGGYAGEDEFHGLAGGDSVPVSTPRAIRRRISSALFRVL